MADKYDDPEQRAKMEAAVEEALGPAVNLLHAIEGRTTQSNNKMLSKQATPSTPSK